MQVVLLHSFQNVLKAVLGHRKARRVTSTSSGLKRLKTQNTMSEKRKGDTLKGIPKSIHKRELILDEEEFDASSFGGDEEDRTLDLTDANCTLSQLSYAPTTFIIITWRREKSIPYFHKMRERKRRRNLSETRSNSNKRSFYISLWYAHSIQTYSIIWKNLHFRLYTLLIYRYNQEAFGFLNACTDQRNVFGLHKTNPLMIHCLLALSVRIESVLFSIRPSRRSRQIQSRMQPLPYTILY